MSKNSKNCELLSAGSLSDQPKLYLLVSQPKSLRDGLGPFLSVYLVAFAGFSPGAAGLLWFIKDMARMIAHVPMGALCDQTNSKRGLIILFTLLSTLTPLIVIWTSNYQILIAKSIVEGIAASGIGIFKGPFTLGIAGHDLFEQASTKTEMADHSGSFSSAVLIGITAYYLYPNVVPMFYVVGVFGILSTISIASLPQYREEYDLDGTMHSVKAVNNEWARNSFHGLKSEDKDLEEIRQMGKKELEGKKELKEEGKLPSNVDTKVPKNHTISEMSSLDHQDDTPINPLLGKRSFPL